MKTITKREVWGAMPPKSQDPLKTPVSMLLMMDTQSAECSTTEECKKIVKELQRVYMEEKGFDDIPWNFLIGGDGLVYEGRGWAVKPIKTDLTNKSQKMYDGRSLDIAYIGNFKSKFPKMEATDLVKDLVEYGIIENQIEKDFEIDNCILPEGTTSLMIDPPIYK